MKNGFFIQFKNTGSNELEIAGIAVKGSSKSSYTICRDDSKKTKLWKMTYKNTKNVVDKTVDIVPCDDTTKDLEFTLHHKSIRYPFAFDFTLSESGKIFAKMWEATGILEKEIREDRAFNTYKTEFTIKTDIAEFYLKVLDYVSRSDIDYLSTNKENYRKPVARIVSGEGDELATIYDYYQNDRRVGLYVQADEENYTVLLIASMAYEVWTIRTEDEEKVTISSVKDDVDKIKGAFKKFFK